LNDRLDSFERKDSFFFKVWGLGHWFDKKKNQNMQILYLAILKQVLPFASLELRHTHVFNLYLPHKSVVLALTQFKSNNEAQI
jgi:hypothetical protein